MPVPSHRNSSSSNRHFLNRLSLHRLFLNRPFLLIVIDSRRPTWTYPPSPLAAASARSHVAGIALPRSKSRAGTCVRRVVASFSSLSARPHAPGHAPPRPSRRAIPTSCLPKRPLTTDLGLATWTLMRYRATWSKTGPRCYQSMAAILPRPRVEGGRGRDGAREGERREEGPQGDSPRPSAISYPRFLLG